MAYNYNNNNKNNSKKGMSKVCGSRFGKDLKKMLDKDLRRGKYF